MTTRAAAKREAALIEDSLAASLSSPAVTPIHDGIKNVDRMMLQAKMVNTSNESSQMNGNLTGIQLPTPTAPSGGKRKRPQAK